MAQWVRVLQKHGDLSLNAYAKPWHGYIFFSLWPQCWDMESQYSLGVTKKPASFMFSKSIYFVGIKRRNIEDTPLQPHSGTSTSFLHPPSIPSQVLIVRYKHPVKRSQWWRRAPHWVSSLRLIGGKKRGNALRRTFGSGWSTAGKWTVLSMVCGMLLSYFLWNIRVCITPPDTPEWKQPAWLN